MSTFTRPPLVYPCDPRDFHCFFLFLALDYADLFFLKKKQVCLSVHTDLNSTSCVFSVLHFPTKSFLFQYVHQDIL